MRVSNGASLNPATEITISAIVKVNGFYAGPCKSNQIFGKVSPYSDYVKGVYSLRFTHADFDCSTPLNTANEVFHAGYGDRDSNPERSAGAFSYPKKVETDKWYHLTYTFKDGVSKFFIDGVLISTEQNPLFVFTANTNDLFIGRLDASQYPFWFNGVIDEIRIYERALCETEVKVLSNLKK